MFSQEFEKQAGFVAGLGKSITGGFNKIKSSLGNIGSKVSPDKLNKAKPKAQQRYQSMKSRKINKNVGRAAIGTGVVGAAAVGAKAIGGGGNTNQQNYY